MGMAALIGAGGLTAYGQQQSGRANQRLANQNGELAEAQAEDALVRGEQDATRRRIKTESQIGSQRARLAAQGVDVNVGSAAEVQAETAALSELDVVTIRNNAAREAWGYRTQASDYRARGQIARMEGTYDALGTLLTTGARAGGY